MVLGAGGAVSFRVSESYVRVQRRPGHELHGRLSNAHSGREDGRCGGPGRTAAGGVC